MRITELLALSEALPNWLDSELYRDDDEGMGRPRKARPGKSSRINPVDDDDESADDVDIKSKNLNNPDDPWDDGVRAKDMHVDVPDLGHVLVSGHFRDRIRQKMRPVKGWTEDEFLQMVFRKMLRKRDEINEIPKDTAFGLTDASGWMAIVVDRGTGERVWRLQTCYPKYRTSKIDSATDLPMRILREHEIAAAAFMDALGYSMDDGIDVIKHISD